MKTLLALALAAGSLHAQTAEELVTKYINAVGGAGAISAVTTLRRTGAIKGSEAPILQENKRPNLVREEYTTQGLTGVTVFDGTTGWKISPWDGNKDPQPLGEEELRGMVEDADFDGPLVDHAGKGNTVTYAGHEDIEGTDTYKLRVKLKEGDVHTYYLDTESCIPVKIEIQRQVRGSRREYELYPGEYKKVAGWYQPFSMEGGTKGSQQRWKVVYDRIEANVPIDESRFARPVRATQEPPR